MKYKGYNAEWAIIDEYYTKLQREPDMAKLKKQEFYTSDSGKTLEIKEMASSHLMNAILHHERQIELLSRMAGTPGALNFVIERRDALEDVVTRLKLELRNRPYSEDEKENSPEPYSRLGGRL